MLVPRGLVVFEQLDRARAGGGAPRVYLRQERLPVLRVVLLEKRPVVNRVGERDLTREREFCSKIRSTADSIQ